MATLDVLLPALALASAPLHGWAAAPDAKDVQSAVCGERVPCALNELRDAGCVGESCLSVAEVALYHPRETSAPTGLEGKCRALEHWLVVRKAAGELSARPLLHICNDGYGSKGLGEDRIEVAANRFTHTRVGGSGWMWSQTNVLQLVPLAVLSETQKTWWTLGDASMSETWRWTDWVGFGSGRGPLCAKAVIPPGSASKAEVVTYAYQPIPRVALDDELRAAAWRTVAFSTCPARVDGRGGASESEPGQGFVIYGKPAGRNGAAMRLLLSSENELFIELEDEARVPRAASWLLADHLELWLGAPPSSGPECVQPSGRLAQWGIGLDGTVHSAFGAPAEPLEVELAESVGANGRRALRFKIRLPVAFAPTDSDAFRITVAYSDSDDGKRQKRIFATSRLKLGSLPTLGRIRDVLPGVGACRREGRELRPLSTRGFVVDKPVLE